MHVNGKLSLNERGKHPSCRLSRVLCRIAANAVLFADGYRLDNLQV